MLFKEYPNKRNFQLRILIINHLSIKINKNVIQKSIIPTIIIKDFLKLCKMMLDFPILK